ncbi:peptidase M23-like protein [Balneicella halophila]|uniref:Peptidase M23-like protein n=1 Tax=Balneicella halophila TaxID=1537566 RepID=A0A7L4US46_BALHA|nr:M23 family metallopeptidase [Balneicella halophila]PVX52593.1 peptidase M23-like protein [Balneicella halophila]
MKIRLIIFFTLASFAITSGQNFPKDYFSAPLDIPMYLSGNFGELRSNHYHSGIDIKTQGREGHKVYATASGVVSRIKVSPYGYGHAIYIDHPNGYTTVYGHLQRFSAKIDKIVKHYQYSQESFAIDEMLASDILKVKKGEVIGFSGNSGSSGGPHLHFEIRETESEYPTNPLLYGFDIHDDVAPVIRGLYIYPLDETAVVDGSNDKKLYRLTKIGNTYSLQNAKVPLVSGKIGFALDTRDYMNGTRNYYGIYQLDMYVDEQLEHSFTFDKFSFSESRYLNAHIDYALYKTHKRRIHKLFHEDNHKESFTEVFNKGIYFKDKQQHSVRIDIADVSGNKIDLKFNVQAAVQKETPNLGGPLLSYYMPNRLEIENFYVKIPALTFYKDIPKKEIQAIPSERKDSYSKQYHFLDETVPLHKNITVGIRPNDIPHHLHDKAFIARKNGSKYRFAGHNWDGKYLTAKTNAVGDFVVLVDTIAPQISLWRGSSFKKTGKLRYKITDNLSGIASFKGKIDGKWVLFEYDPKLNIIWHILSPEVITKVQKHKLELEVKDSCGNIGFREAYFTW